MSQDTAAHISVRTFVLCVMTACWCVTSARGQETGTSPRVTPTPNASAIPEGYEVGAESLSPNGQFAILYPVRGESLANVLVRLKPYVEIAKICDDASYWQGMRGEPMARWNGNSVVAIWSAQKWGMADLSIYEIENDKIKRVQPVWKEVRKYFDRDFKGRFLKKYPKESDQYFFVSDNDEKGLRDLEFKGHRLLLNLSADNKPNLAGGPHWSATLHAIWDLDKAKFEKLDFLPGTTEIRPDLAP
jgi:hypothetical protein